MVSSRRWPLLLLGGGVLVFLLVGCVAAGIFLYLRWREAIPPGWRDPISEVQIGTAEASTALLSLADASDTAVASEAIDEGSLEGAYATIVFSTTLNDNQRLGWLLRLGKEYVAAGNRSQAKLCYQQVADIATLSPDLSDLVRAQAYVETALGLSRLGMKKESRFNLDQAHTVVLHSPQLRGTHRVSVLDSLVQTALALGDKTLAAQYAGERDDLLEGESEVSTKPEEATELPGLAGVTLSPAAEEATARRRAAAEKLSQRLSDSPDEIPSDLVHELVESLRLEDQARLDFYQAQMAEVAQPSAKAALVQAKVDWLTIKYRVARQGYGLSLVSDWEEKEDEVKSELSKAYEELYGVRSDQAVSLPQAEDVDRALEALLRREILAGRLGLYPNYPEVELIDELREVTKRLTDRLGEVFLYIDTVTQDGTTYFKLVSAE
ncbi:MAG: hypothetical protein ACE5NP_11970 [Anaerolineae bacterium]